VEESLRRGNEAGPIALALVGWLMEDLHVPGKREVLLDRSQAEMVAVVEGPKGKGKRSV
jgi:hypothetical protein